MTEEGAGQYSITMRVVIMNRCLKEDDVPENVLDYCLLKQFANVGIGIGIEAYERNDMVADLLSDYPGSIKAAR